MNHRNITAKDVFNRMVELAEQDPDFCYKGQYVIDEDGDEIKQTTCSYLGMDTENPHLGRPCIVGQALADLGFTREELAEVEDMFARHALAALGIAQDGNYRKAIGLVQAAQDNGATWSGAIAHAAPVL